MNLKQVVKKSINMAETSYYHRAQKLKALAVLAQLENNSARKLSKQVRSTCDSYAVEILGDITYANWLYVYSHVSDGFKEGWIPANYFSIYVVSKLKGLHGEVSGLRSLNRLVLDSDTFPDIGSYINGLFFDEHGSLIPESKISSLLFRDRSMLIFKKDESEQGDGVYFFTSADFQTGKIRLLGNGVFQSIVTPHPDLAKFSSQALSTLRITTVSTDDAEIQIRACDMKVGGVGTTHVLPSSFVRIPVDIKTGRFMPPAYRLDWSIASQSDYGGESFADRSFPHFSDACDVVLKLHQKVPYVRCIGWDVAIDDNGQVKVLEWNGFHNDIKFGEATQGPCFADLGWEKIWRKRQELVL